MSALISRFSAVLLCLFICAIPFPKAANAAITVEDRQLVSKRRVGRAAFKYTYKISVKVEGPGVENAVVFVTCDNAGTTVLGEMFGGELMADTGVVELGNLAGDTTILSDDTFTIRQNRRIPFDPDCLVYDIAYESTVVLSGVVTDNPLSFANVIIIVDYREAGRPIIEAFSDPDAGRPIIETFNTVADAEGNYEVEVSVGAQDGFVTVTGDGTTMEQEGAQLTSNLGSVGGLHTSGLPGSIVVGGEDVTHITTALAVLAEQAAGGEILSDEDLQAFEAQVPGEDLINLAAAIKTVVDNPDIDIPGGGDFLEFLSDPDATEAFVEETMEENPEEFAAAFDDTVEELTLVYDEAELDDTTLYVIRISESPFESNGGVLTLDAGGTGELIVEDGSCTTVWFVDGNGDLIVEPDDCSETFFFFCEVPGEQVEATLITEEIKLQRIVEGVASDQVFVTGRERTVFPAICELDDEIEEDEPSPDDVFLTFNESQITPIDPAELDGETFAAQYYHVDNEAVGLFDPRFGADFLTLNPDGTGSTQRTGFAFNWSVDAAGRLDIAFGNGDTSQFVVLVDDGGPIVHTLVISDLTDGTRLSIPTRVIDPDGASEFSEDDLSDQHYRQTGAVLADSAFDFLFESGGTGCRRSEAGGNPFTWVSTADNRMELIRRFVPEPDIIILQRSWEGAVTVMGELGDRIWLIENLDITDTFDNTFVPGDPTMTPGRINSYEKLPGLAGNTLPVAMDDFVATDIDTPIDVVFILDNDSDADGDMLFIAGADNMSDEGGTIELLFESEDFFGLAVSSVLYTPPALFEGEDRFSYFISDFRDCGAPIEGEVFITVGDP